MREYARVYVEEDLFAFRTFWSAPRNDGACKRSTRVNPASCATTIAVFTRLGQLLLTASARAVEAIIFGNTFILKPIMPIGKAMVED